MSLESLPSSFNSPSAVSSNIGAVRGGTGKSMWDLLGQEVEFWVGVDDLSIDEFNKLIDDVLGIFTI
jgi:hypothetical protein